MTERPHNGRTPLRAGSIREAREAADMTQLQLALRIGVRERTVIRWEKGQHAPRTDIILWRVAKATRKPLDFFADEVTV